MLCSICNKNTAVIFVNKQLPDKSFATEGLCYDCAKKKGINPLEALSKQANLSEEDMKDMANQIENMFKDMSDNIDIDAIIDMESGENNFDDNGEIPNGAIPLGSIFSNMFGMKNNSENTDGSTSSNKKKVKVNQKPKDKKKKALDTFGTNLSFKAQNNELDNVVGRNREIQRIVQILNRRAKNNPCLIGEPGVGKTAIAQGLAIKIAKRKRSC